MPDTIDGYFHRLMSAVANTPVPVMPSGVAGELLIAGLANGLALDSTTLTTGDIKPVVWEIHGEPWQRWRLDDSPDGIGYLIQSVHNRQYLTVNRDAEPRWNIPFRLAAALIVSRSN